jgi:tripartite-type tricarboxylate transporter receptor subunit TctC
VILPGPAGGLIDVGSRAVSDALQRELGQPWLIDPRPGASGIVAAQMMLARRRTATRSTRPCRATWR